MKPATRVNKVCLWFSMQGEGHYSAIINVVPGAMPHPVVCHIF